MTTRLTPDICIIGAGSGGLTTAAAAAAFGVEVVLIEKGRMGGDCLNYGCVPSKAMLAAARHANAIREAAAFGVRADPPSISRSWVNEHVAAVIAAIEPNDSEARFTAMGVKVIREAARFADARTVTAGEYEIRARRFVVASGSSPLVPAIPGLEAAGYLTNETLFSHPRKPAHLIIIGGGPVGMEMAQAHVRLGSQVTVVEAMTALGRDDPEMAAIVIDALRREGVAILEGTRIVRIETRGKAGVRVIADDGSGERPIDGTTLLVAAGRKANTEGLGLDAAGIKHDGKGIKVNARLRSSNRRVYAVGDVAGGPQFTHVAGYHAGQAIRSILFRSGGKVDLAGIPWVTFTDPELAHVGLREIDARRKHGRLQVLRWPYHDNDRAQIERRSQGHIKIVATRGGHILGATIAGAHAGEMIHFWALAVARGMRLRDILAYVPPYPTFSEIGRRAVIASYAPLARKPWVRSVIGLLRLLG